jgi:hypothetical protein
MSRQLSETNIEVLEQFIANNTERDDRDSLPAISERDRDDAVSDWKTINDPNTPVTTYLQFASNSHGMSSYAFYKSRNGSIFLVCAFCNNLTSYHIVPPDWYILVPYDEYIKREKEKEKEKE